MKFKKTGILALALALISVTAYGALQVERRDLKLSTQALLEHQTISAPAGASTAYILDDQATSASATTTVTSLTQPDVARVVTITPGGTTADVPADDIVVSGTDWFGDSISETFTLSANQSTIESGTKAFASITSIVFPIQDGAGATYDVGINEYLGMKRCMASAGHLFSAVFGGVYEGTRPACTADADEVEKNVCDLNSALDGSSDVELFFVQNFACIGQD